MSPINLLLPLLLYHIIGNSQNFNDQAFLGHCNIELDRASAPGFRNVRQDDQSHFEQSGEL